MYVCVCMDGWMYVRTYGIMDRYMPACMPVCLCVCVCVRVCVCVFILNEFYELIAIALSIDIYHF